MSKIGMLMLFFGLTLVCARAQAPEPSNKVLVKHPASLSGVRSELFERVSSGKEPSYSIAVVENGKLIWSESIGWADRERRIGATPSTLYAVASVSKSITGTGVLAMIAKNKFELKSSAYDILGDGWAAANQELQREITISQLLAHTSGVPHLWNYEYFDNLGPNAPTDSLVWQGAGVAAKPGSRYLYTNLGFGILARVVAKAGNNSFQKVMEQELFKPLGMKKTTADGWLSDQGYVRGYDSNGHSIPYRFRLAPVGGAGFFSTLQDLSDYMLFHLGAGNYASKIRASSISDRVPELRTQLFSYANGWASVRLDEYTVLLSNGQMAGGTAAIFLVPEKRMGVVVLCNQTGGPVDSTAAKILSVLIGGFEKQFEQYVGQVEADIVRPSSIPQSVFEGTLGNGENEKKISLDTTDLSAPVLELEGVSYVLKEIEWERGSFLATAVGSMPSADAIKRTHNLSFTLWTEGQGIEGFALEIVADERPRSGVPYRVMLKPKP